jgi:hypothetical protein
MMPRRARGSTEQALPGHDAAVAVHVAEGEIPMQYLGFGSLWLQVLIVAVVTFMVSGVFWTTMPWHRSEFKALPNEDAVRKVLHAQGVTEGQWRIPYSENPADWKTEEFAKRYETGPVGIIQLETPSGVAMGSRLVKTFGLYFLVAFFTAYVLRQAFPVGAPYMKVFQLAGCVSFASHVFGQVQDTIWFSKSWRRVLLQAADSVVYALLTAGVFASMWPDA